MKPLKPISITFAWYVYSVHNELNVITSTLRLIFFLVQTHEKVEFTEAILHLFLSLSRIPMVWNVSVLSQHICVTAFFITCFVCRFKFLICKRNCEIARSLVVWAIITFRSYFLLIFQSAEALAMNSISQPLCLGLASLTYSEGKPQVIISSVQLFLLLSLNAYYTDVTLLLYIHVSHEYQVDWQRKGRL